MISKMENPPIEGGGGGAFIVEYTEYIRPHMESIVKAKFPEITKTNYFIFNGGIIEWCADYYLVSARVIVPKCNEIMTHSELPTMWWNAKAGDVECGKWNSFMDQGLIALMHIPTFRKPPTVVATHIIETMHSNEDPRLYRKADGKIYICTTTTHVRPCDALPQKERCAYMSEYEIHISERKTFEHNTFQILLKSGKTPLCMNILGQQQGVFPIMKNLSHWTYKGVDYLTDYSSSYSDYTIYVQTRDRCDATKVNNETQCFKNIAECFRIRYSQINRKGRLETLSLLNFNGTTPSVRVSDEIMDKYFPDLLTPLYCGVAHIRMQLHNIISGELLATTQRVLRSHGPGNLYSDVADFIDQTHERKQSGNLFEKPFPEVYVMMLYFFRPDVNENGNRGQILYTSDIFYPLAMSPSNKLVTRFALAFPVGLMFAGEEICISYGEGDVKLFMMIADLDTLGLHAVKCVDPTIRFKTLSLPSNRRATDITKRSADSLETTLFNV